MIGMINHREGTLKSVRWQYVCMLLVCFGLLFLQSCKSTVLLAEGEVSSSELVVREHIGSNNVIALMSDYVNSPKYRGEIVSSILDVDVTQLSDYQLGCYLNNAAQTDSILWNYYYVEKTNREIRALKSTFGERLESVVGYCNANAASLPYLSEFIDASLKGNIATMSYLEKKNALGLFQGDELGDLLRDEIRQYKNDNKQKIQQQLESYLQAERALINYYEYAIRLVVYLKVYDCFPSMMMAVFDGTMPENRSDCDWRFRNAVNSHFSQNAIDVSVRMLLDEAAATINENRQQILNTLTITGLVEKASSVSMSDISLPAIEFSYNMSPIYEISNIDNEQKSVGKSILGFFFPVIGFVSGAMDASDQGEREKPYVEKFVGDFGRKLVPACEKYINFVVSKLRTLITNSQQQFVKEYYHAY